MGALILVANVILGGLVLWLAVEFVVSARRPSGPRIPERAMVRRDPRLR